MASSDMLNRLRISKNDLNTVVTGPNFNRIKNSSALMDPWSDARDLAVKWLAKAEPFLPKLDDSSIQPLESFVRGVVEIADGRGLRQNEAIPDALRRVKSEFQSAKSLLAYELLDASGILEVSEENFLKWKDNAVSEVHASIETAKQSINEIVADADTSLKASAKEAGEEFEFLKAEASKISVESAKQQFESAGTILRIKAAIWTSITSAVFIALVFLLRHFLLNPPELIHDVVEAIKPGSTAILLPVSTPLLIATSAYFTSIRLAIIGILGVGLAFGLRMTRAYFHMIEHNQHKLRVTNSIEAFVAAVRTKEQKDLVLSKLIEAVTEFGDSGILDKEEKPSGFPSVIFEALTKNVSKD
jgi:ElaB/YqjD/DUF883 family membrane-anchored ribosome-binding protein